MGDQITEGIHTFAFYDTVKDRFVEFSGEMAWETEGQFKEAFRYVYEKPTAIRWEEPYCDDETYPLTRFTQLIPKDWRLRNP